MYMSSSLHTYVHIYHIYVPFSGINCRGPTSLAATQDHALSGDKCHPAILDHPASISSVSWSLAAGRYVLS